MKHLLSYLSEYKKETILGPAFKLLEAVLELFVPLVVAAVIDIGIAGGNRPYVIRMSLILILLGAAGLTVSVIAQYFAAKASTGFSKRVRHELFSKILRFSYTQMDEAGTSTLITRMTSDMNQVQTGVNMTMRLVLRSPFVILGAMVMAFTIDGRSALVFVVTIPVLALVVGLIMRVTIPGYRSVQGKLDRVVDTTRENLTGVRVIRAFCNEDEEIHKFRERNEELTETQLSVGRISAWMNPLTFVVVNLAIAALIYTGALRVDSGYLTQGEVVALYNYMMQILVELIKLANLIVTLTRASACGDRIWSVLDPEKYPMEDILRQERSGHRQENKEREGELREAVQGKAEASANQKKEGAAEETFGFGDPRKETREKHAPAVELYHARLLYRGASRPALQDISFSADYGETIGIIGGTGAGKTSLVHMIAGFYPCSDGEVRIDGKRLEQTAEADLRRKIGIVPQKAVLFAGTIRENMQWGDAEADDARILDAIEKAHVRDAVDKDDGLDMRIEQGGLNLSGGQRQRFTIARALVKRPQILILDDSFSALDFATEAKLRREIGDLMPKPLVFLVSQRVSSIRHADRIIVLDRGEIAGIGTHEELLATCEIYREIARTQGIGGAA